MESYIVFNGQKIELTAEQVEQLKAAQQEKTIRLGDKAVGDIAKIGDHEMIVLEHVGAATLLIRKDLLDTMQFGENNNYDGSYADEACNEFAGEIAGIVGEDRVLPHTVDLTSDDGLKDYGEIQRRASLLTTEQYRRYVHILDKHKAEDWWWLATAHSTAAHGNDAWVKCVAPSGYINYNRYYNFYGSGVRPFCILKSDIFVSA